MQVFNQCCINAVVPGDQPAQTGGIAGAGGDAGRQAAQRGARRGDGAHAMDVDQVNVGEGDRAVVSQYGQCYRRAGGLSHRTGDIGHVHHRLVVGAGNGDADGAIHRAAMAIVKRDGEGLKLSLARSQVFNCRSSNAVVPADHTTEAGAGAVGADARGQRAQRCRRGSRYADAVRIGQVHIGEGDRAAVAQVTHRGKRFGDSAGDIGGCHQRRIVGARDGDGHQRG